MRLCEEINRFFEGFSLNPAVGIGDRIELLNRIRPHLRFSWAERPVRRRAEQIEQTEAQVPAGTSGFGSRLRNWACSAARSTDLVRSPGELRLELTEIQGKRRCRCGGPRRHRQPEDRRLLNEVALPADRSSSVC